MNYLEACRTLGLESNASAAEEKAAYRRLAQAHHPDKGGDAERFKQITLAHRVFVKYAPLMKFATAAPPRQAQYSQQPPPKKEKTFSDEEIDAMRRAVERAELQRGMLMAENQRIVLFLGGFFLVFYFVWQASGDFFLHYACFLIDLVFFFFFGAQAVFSRCMGDDWSLPIYAFMALLLIVYTIASSDMRRRILRASYFGR